MVQRGWTGGLGKGNGLSGDRSHGFQPACGPPALSGGSPPSAGRGTWRHCPSRGSHGADRGSIIPLTRKVGSGRGGRGAKLPVHQPTTAPSVRTFQQWDGRSTQGRGPAGSGQSAVDRTAGSGGLFVRD